MASRLPKLLCVSRHSDLFGIIILFLFESIGMAFLLIRKVITYRGETSGRIIANHFMPRIRDDH